jgi:hypothetical protein
MKIDRLQGTSTGLLRALAWEFVQNLPLVAGFLLGLDLWQRHRPLLAVACIVVGSVLGSLAIWATESRIVAGHREPVQVVVTNVVVIAGLMFVLILYLSALWSRWWTDLLFGVAGGVLLGAAQDLAARSPIGVVHCAAMALAFALALVAIRLLSGALPLAANVLAITAFATLVIGSMDYGTLGAERLP